MEQLNDVKRLEKGSLATFITNHVNEQVSTENIAVKGVVKEAISPEGTLRNVLTAEKTGLIQMVKRRVQPTENPTEDVWKCTTMNTR